MRIESHAFYRNIIPKHVISKNRFARNFLTVNKFVGFVYRTDLLPTKKKVYIRASIVNALFFLPLLTGHVELELSVCVHSHLDPFERARFYLFEVNYIVTGRSVSVGVEMEVIARQTCNVWFERIHQTTLQENIDRNTFSRAFILVADATRVR